MLRTKFLFLVFAVMLSFITWAFAAEPPACPSVAAVNQIVLNEVELEETGYTVYYDGYLPLGTTRPWQPMIIYLEATTAAEAQSIAQSAIQTVTEAFDIVAAEDTEKGMWVCLYITNNPAIYPVLISPIYQKTT